VEEATRLGQGALTAAIGPGARGCCYEVGDELIDRFAIYGSAAINGDHLDLATVARQQLVAAGVDQIIDCGICTICSSEDQFFSYRRDGGETGRMIGAVWLS